MAISDYYEPRDRTIGQETKKPKPTDGWIQTRSGGMFFPNTPDPTEIRIDDVATALSRICRFGGHSIEFYSVAQHSVLVSKHCPNLPLAGLLHDASEAYLGDMPSPIKRLLPVFSEMEYKVARAVGFAFGVRIEEMESLEVKAADLRALATEKRDLMAPEPWPWFPLPDPWESRIDPWEPGRARVEFLREFERLKHPG